MGALPRISDAEWEVMKVVWDRHPVKAHEVIDAVAPSTSWSPKTIRTLLNRLVEKGAIAFHVCGRSYEYYPLVRQEECVSAENRSFLQRVHDGALAPMLAYFIENERLSREEIVALRRILDKKRGTKP